MELFKTRLSEADIKSFANIQMLQRMKNAFLYFILFFSLHENSFGQAKRPSLFYDAKFIRDSCLNSSQHFNYNQFKNLVAIFKTYYPGFIDTTSGINTFNRIIKSNIFLGQYVPFIDSNLRWRDGSKLSYIGNALSSVGGLDVTNIANGIADLIIARAKQELTIAFFDRFRQFSKDNNEFPLLFPKTADNLNKLLTYAYPQMLPALRAAFLEDLKQLAYHLDDVLELPRYKTILTDFPEVRMAIRSLKLVHELETGASNAADIIDEFASFPEWKDEKSSNDLKNVGFCLSIANLFSQSIRSRDDFNQGGNDSSQSNQNTIWVPGKDLKVLFYDTTLFRIYLGLIYQKSIIDSIQYTETNNKKRPFSDMLATQKSNLFLIQNKLKEFFDLADKVDATLLNIQAIKKSGKAPADDDYYNYINVSTDVVEYGFNIVKIFDNVRISDDFLSLARKSNSLYKDIYTKQYTQAVGDAFDILGLMGAIISPKVNINGIKDTINSVIKNDTTAVMKNISKLVKGGNINGESIDNVAKANISNQEVVKLIQYRSLENLLTFLKNVKPYALFMANMVEAKDEDAVKAALENVILPVGSTSIKKNSVFNISIQSYLGGYLSMSAGSVSASGTWSDKFGVIAPIGVSFNKGLNKGAKRNYGSISAFVSLFDLGAIVDYKLKKDSTVTGNPPTVVSKDYSVKLGQIVSPGVYAVYGFFGNLPLSLGFGGQYGPGLSKIDAGSNTVINNPSWRWSLFLAVDLPFFTLKNKMRNE